jgi:hypothetical protein
MVAPLGTPGLHHHRRGKPPGRPYRRAHGPTPSTYPIPAVSAPLAYRPANRTAGSRIACGGPLLAGRIGAPTAHHSPRAPGLVNLVVANPRLPCGDRSAPHRPAYWISNHRAHGLTATVIRRNTPGLLSLTKIENP